MGTPHDKQIYHFVRLIVKLVDRLSVFYMVQYRSNEPLSSLRSVMTSEIWVNGSVLLGQCVLSDGTYVFTQTKSSKHRWLVCHVFTSRHRLQYRAGEVCSSVVREFAHGAMDRRIDPSWWTLAANRKEQPMWWQRFPLLLSEWSFVIIVYV